jgi:hypothetical protein
LTGFTQLYDTGGSARIWPVRVARKEARTWQRYVLFGTNYFLEIDERDGKVNFLLGAHHQAFQADASETRGELEKYIREIMEKHPESVFEEA